ncbi:MAG: DNA-directed RNA polymerase subunit B, partial [archaeon]
ESRHSKFLNISYNKKLDTVYIVLERNRVVRPLIVVKDGVHTLPEDKMRALREGAIKWSDLVKEGIIEYLDALEEEDALVALNESDITRKHTHLELNPVTIFSMTTSMLPYANFNQSSKLGKGHKTQKQAMGCYTLSFQNRMDTTVNLLHYPQRPITKSFTQSLLGDELSAGQNLVIAIINWDGYNMSDALVINRASIERGAGRSSHFRPYITEKLRYPGGQIDEIRIPEKDVSGYTIEKDYRFLTEDGIIYPEAEVNGGDVVIGKTSPPRFLGKLEAFSTAANIRKDASVRVRYGEGGVINKVMITESEEGSQLIKVEVRENRLPEIGDKFSSKHAQKGVIGAIASPEDMPFSASGIVPDIVFSPNGLPRRLTGGHIIEALAGKVGALAGRYVDGTPFQSEEVSDLRAQLSELGFVENGTETLYDGKTGREYKAKIFVGNIYYLRLKHQVADKIQVRARGPVTLLTRQPTEGKAKEGGLRLGEMEKDCFAAHGASLLLKERFDSDRIVVWVCEHCGNLAIYDAYKSKAYCLCGEKVRICPVEMSYAFKLFLDELKSMHIKPKLILKEKY